MECCALAFREDAHVSSGLRLSLANRNPTAFQSGAMCTPFPDPVGEPGVGFRPHVSQWEPPAAEISLWCFGCWERGRPLSFVCPPSQSLRGFFCKSLVIRLLLNWASVDYSGRGECSANKPSHFGQGPNLLEVSVGCIRTAYASQTTLRHTQSNIERADKWQSMFSYI